MSSSTEQRYGCGRFKQKPRRWTEEEDRYVREHTEMSHKELAEELGRTVDSVKGYCDRKKYLRDDDGCFKKGQKPFNKGKKPSEYMSPEAIEAMRATQFKAGHKPHNTKFDGAITIRHSHHNAKIPYLYIRLEEGNWKEYHRYLWEKHRGPVPAHHVICFIDGNTMNCCLENLKCISRAENARRNTNWEKAMQTMKENGTHPSINLTDNYVAGMISGHDEEIKEHILNSRPDLIKLARANYKLKRRINNESS